MLRDEGIAVPIVEEDLDIGVEVGSANNNLLFLSHEERQIVLYYLERRGRLQ